MIDGTKSRMLIIHNRKLKNYTALEPDQCVDAAGVKVQLISAPGHTPGSSMYLLDDTILFTGDTISLTRDGQIGPFSFVQNMNHKENSQTVTQLKTAGVFDTPLLIATGHYGIYKK